MRHQAGHVAAFVADAGNVLERTIRIRRVGQVSIRIAVSPQNLVVGLELGQSFLVGKVAAFPVSDGDAQDFPGRDFIREGRIRRGGFEVNVLAMELEVAVADERAGQQTCLGEHLEAVADADDESAIGGELFYGLHHGAEPRDRAAA